MTPIYNKSLVMHLIIMIARTLSTSTDSTLWQHYMNNAEEAKEEDGLDSDYNI